MPPRHTALTTRATLLALVICVLVLTLAYPLRLYLQQQAKISELTRTNAASQQRVDELRAAVARYDDPAWVRDEARRRLHYVLPGERSYLMPTAAPSAAASDGTAGERVDEESWYGRLWSQVGPTPASPEPEPTP